MTGCWCGAIPVQQVWDVWDSHRRGLLPASVLLGDDQVLHRYSATLNMVPAGLAKAMNACGGGVRAAVVPAADCEARIRRGAVRVARWESAVIHGRQDVDCSASAPREPPHGPLDRAAGASLLEGDPGHDGVHVHAAAAPGGLSAAAATGGTTHVVLLKLALNYWLTMNYNIPPWVLSVVGNRPQSQLVDALRPAGGAFR